MFLKSLGRGAPWGALVSSLLLAATVSPAEPVFTDYAGKIATHTAPTAITTDGGRVFYTTLSSTTSAAYVIDDPIEAIGSTEPVGRLVGNVSFSTAGRGLNGIQVDSQGVVYTAGDTGNTTTFIDRWDPQPDGSYVRDTAFRTAANGNLGRIQGGIALITDDIIAVPEMLTGRVHFITSTGALARTPLDAGAQYLREVVYNPLDGVLYSFRNSGADDVIVDGYITGVTPALDSLAWNAHHLIPDGANTFTINMQHGYYDAVDHRLISLDSKPNLSGSRQIRLWDIADNGTSVTLAQGISPSFGGANFTDIDDAAISGPFLYVTSQDENVIHVYSRGGDFADPPVYTETVPDNAIVETSVAKLAGTASVFFRKESEDTYYEARLTNSELQFHRSLDGEVELIGRRALVPAYATGEEWTLTLTMVEDNTRATLRDEGGAVIVNASILDDNIPSGGIAFGGDYVTSWGTPSVTELTPNVTAVADLLPAYDVVVIGAGTGGSMAAIQAARLGASVLLVEETDWIGGQMSAAAVTSMDEGNETPSAGVSRDSPRERGLYREFFHRAVDHYDTIGLSTDTPYISENHFGLEPHPSRTILYNMIQDTRRMDGGQTLHLILRGEVTGVAKSGNRVTGVTIDHTTDSTNSRSFSSEILIDATELGDVIPMTGARYRLGNWISDQPFPEPGEMPQVQEFTWAAVIKEYRDGVPAEMLLPQEPPAYSTAPFSLALDNYAGLDPTSTSPWSWQRFVGYRGMPDSARPFESVQTPWPDVTRTHTNFAPNDAHVNINDIEDPSAWLDKEYDLKLITLHLLWYIQNDMTEPITTWAVANDSGYDTPYNIERNQILIDAFPDLAPFQDILNHFPVMPYMRESRRIEGVKTVRAAEVDRRYGPTLFPTSVAVADYGTDLHGADSPDTIESDLDTPSDLEAIGFAGDKVGPFLMPYEAFIPETVDGFLAAEKNVGQSRLVNGATRLQPSTMLMGQAAGAIAAVAVALDVDPRDMPALFAQRALLEADTPLYVLRFDAHKFPGVEQYTKEWRALQLSQLYGLVFPEDVNLILPGWQVYSGGLGDGGWSVDSQGRYRFNGATGIAAYTGDVIGGTPAADLADYEVRTHLMRNGGSGAFGLVARMSDAQNFYHARFFGTNLQLYKWVNNSATLLGSSAVGYTNGEVWELVLEVDGTQVTARAYDALGNLAGTISETDTSHSAGTGGFRAQSGDFQVFYDDFEIRDLDGNVLYEVDFAAPLDVSVDVVTRERIAFLLARQFDLNLDDAPTSPTFGDIGLTHRYFREIEAAHAAGLLPFTGAKFGGFDAGSTVTRGEIAFAIAQGLGLDPAEAPATPLYTDVTETHPYFTAIQLVGSLDPVPGFFANTGGQFLPDEPVILSEYFEFFADLLLLEAEQALLEDTSVLDWHELID